ncbi:MAG TPA: glycerol kinase [Clostridiales bacterium]|nr:glycerol kinase [Clostridiales bacterium]
MGKYIISVDQGTTSTKAFLLDKEGSLHPSNPYPIKQYYPKPGYVEHDADEIYLSVLKSIADLMLNNPEARDDIDCLAITNQRETTIAFSNENGRITPFCKAIVWQCRRTADICRRKKIASREAEILAKTGLKLDPYFSATKMRWILENVPGAQKAAASGELKFATVDGYLVANLTGGRNFASDYSNCSRTMLFNIVTLDYDRELLDLFEIPRSALADPTPSCSDFGMVNLNREDLKRRGLTDREIEVLTDLNGVRICGVAGDQAAALFGQNCFDKGDTKTTYGTGCFTLMNIGEEPAISENGLLTSAAWSLNGKTTYALEGSVFQGGSVISWLKDELGLIEKPSDCDEICMSLEDNGGVYLVPAFTGMGAPYWDPDLRGTITGLTRGSGRKHIVRAGVESIAYQVTELVDLMMNDTGIISTHMKVDGGVCACSFLMQLQADLLGVRITRAVSDEMTAMGAGLMAGLTSGLYSSLEEVKSLYVSSREYYPGRSAVEAGVFLDEYRKAVAASRAASGKDGEEES